MSAPFILPSVKKNKNNLTIVLNDYIFTQNTEGG